MGLGIGFCIGLTGIGGGVLVLPALNVVLRLPPSMCVGTASLYAFLTKVFATYHHFKLKTIDGKVCGLLLAGALPANVLSSAFVNWFVKHAASDDVLLRFQTGLKYLMVSVAIIAAGTIMVRLFRAGRRAPGAEATHSVADRLNSRPTLRAVIAVLAGALVGALIGLTSIGGGVIIVPLLMVVFGLTSSRTVGSSIFVAVVLTLVTSVVYLGGAQLDVKTAAIMAAGALAGVPGGSKLSVRMPERPLQWILSGLIVVAAVLMLLKQTAH
jgi:uncharacterized membrane protein YfcA